MSIDFNKLLEEEEMSNENPLALLKTAGNLPATQEQQAIFSFILDQPGNLLVNASAGSSKTTTIVEAVNHVVGHQRLEPRNILAIAFNKSIADTLRDKMPTGVWCSTMNAMGHQALRSYFGRVNINQRKTNNILSEMIPGFYQLRPAERRSLKDMFQKAKMQGHWPSEEEWIEAQTYMGLKAKPMPQLRKQIAARTGIKDFFDTYVAEHDVSEDLLQYLELLPICYAMDIIHSLDTGEIEFIDQIFLSATLASVSLPRFLLVVADEAQDFSRIEQFLISLMVSVIPKGRLVAVGDKSQAIYAFKGADPRAFDALQEKWKATLLPLSTSFRCSHKVVQAAQDLDPRIKPWDQAKEGSVLSLDDWDTQTILEGTTILCRLNAPLVRLAVDLIKNGRGCQFAGRDLEQNLVSFLDQHSKNLQSLTGLNAHLKSQIAEKAEKSPYEADRMQDSWECIQAIFSLYEVQYLDDGEGAILRFFKNSGGILLSSIHKAKGLEWPHVALLRPDLIPHPRAVESGDVDQLQQERNLHYVALTRSSDTFTYLQGKDY